MMKSLRVPPLRSQRQQRDKPTSKKEAMHMSSRTGATSLDSDDDADNDEASIESIAYNDDRNDNEIEEEQTKDKDNDDEKSSLKRSSTLEALNEMREELERMRILKLRQELEALKLQAKIKERQRQHELQQVQIKFQMANSKLQEQIERTHNPMYMKFLTCEYLAHEQRKQLEQPEEDREEPTSATAPAVVSTEVLQSETPLLSIMHRAFLVVPTQMELTKKLYKHEIEKYLKQQIRSLRRENVKVSMDVVQKLSQKAEENDQLYETYQQIVQQQGEEIRKLKQKKAMKEDPLKGTSDHSNTSATGSFSEDFDTSASSTSSFWEMPIPALILRTQNKVMK